MLIFFLNLNSAANVDVMFQYVELGLAPVIAFFFPFRMQQLSCYYRVCELNKTFKFAKNIALIILYFQPLSPLVFVKVCLTLW